MNTLPTAPKYSTCWYCLNKVEGSHTKETEVQYTCNNHLPLRIIWYCVRQNSEKWFFNRIMVVLPNQFRLYWQLKFRVELALQGDENNYFYLHEWKKPEPDGRMTQWGLVRDGDSIPKKFSADWVLTQSTERLQSLLEMYKVFS